MLEINNLSWILLAAIVCILDSHADASAIREDIAIVRICNATDPVNRDVFNAYMMHHDFERLEGHSAELSCFLLCIYNQYKWMDRNGNFKTHKIKTWMRKANVTFPDREVLVQKCVTGAEESDPCTRARLFTECFWLNNQSAYTLDDVDHTLHTIIGKETGL